MSFWIQPRVCGAIPVSGCEVSLIPFSLRPLDEALPPAPCRRRNLVGSGGSGPAVITPQDRIAGAIPLGAPATIAVLVCPYDCLNIHRGSQGSTNSTSSAVSISGLSSTMPHMCSYADDLLGHSGRLCAVKARSRYSLMRPCRERTVSSRAQRLLRNSNLVLSDDYADVLNGEGPCTQRVVRTLA
jgi:hypothetical protein